MDDLIRAAKAGDAGLVLKILRESPRRGVRVDGQTGAVTYSWTVTPEWLATCAMQRLTDGRLVIASLHIEPAGDVVPPDGLTIGVLKAVRLGPVRAYAALNSSRPPVAPRKEKQDSRGRPPTLTPRFYREVWTRYLALLKKQARNPAKTLAEEYGYTRTGMRSVLRRCRQMPELERIGNTPKERHDGKTSRSR